MGERLSSIETLPAVAVPAIQRAFDAIMVRRETQDTIRRILNIELEEVGLGPVSSSGFNRYVQKVRDGLIGRPIVAISMMTLVPEAGIVFAESFRGRLVGAIGEDATMKIEIAMQALAVRGGM